MIARVVALIGMVDVRVEPAGIGGGRAVAPGFVADEELVEPVGVDSGQQS